MLHKDVAPREQPQSCGKDSQPPRQEMLLFHSFHVACTEQSPRSYAKSMRKIRSPADKFQLGFLKIKSCSWSAILGKTLPRGDPRTPVTYMLGFTASGSARTSYTASNPGTYYTGNWAATETHASLPGKCQECRSLQQRAPPALPANGVVRKHMHTWRLLCSILWLLPVC